MRLYLCEKPSQAKDLAAVIGGASLKSDHLEVNGGAVTWASGHLLELPKPDELHPKYKRWDPNDLPILPKDFRWQPRDRTRPQLAAIGRLLQKADSVVIATDAEREGELIARLILNHHNYQGSLQRLWITALDPDSVKKALSSPLDGQTTFPLYQSALLRAKSDWLVGMNASRAASSRLGGPGRPVAIGRVQTPTMALIVKRDKEIETFKPESFQKLEANVVSVNGVPLTLAFDGPAQDVPLAYAALKDVKSANLSVEETDITEAPPPLFNLSGLQQKTNAVWGWHASHTLNILQGLYEKHKVLSYPRSDSTVLPVEQQAQIPQVLAVLSGTVLSSKLPKTPVIRDTVFVKDLDTAHNAIVPTLKAPDFNQLNGDERKAYLLVAKAYVANLLPDFKGKELTYKTDVNGHMLSTKAVSPTNLGWKTLSKLPEPPPPVEPGTATFSPNISNHETKPPEPYSDGTLIGDMTAIKQFITNPRILDILDDKAALGTEATRASIIDDLVDSGFVQRDGLHLKSDPKAKELVGQLTQYAPLLVDPGETAIWEDGLKRIEKGTLTEERFMDGIEKRVHSHVKKLLEIPRPSLRAEDVVCGNPTDLLCPSSGLPVRDVGKGWVFPGYGEVFCPKKLAGMDMDPEDYNDIFRGEFVPREFTSKAGKPFFANLVYNKEAGKIEFDFSVEPPYSGPDMG